MFSAQSLASGDLFGQHTNGVACLSTFGNIRIKAAAFMLTNKHIGLAIAVTNIIVGCIVILNNQIRLLDLRALK